MFHRWISEQMAKMDVKDYIEPEREMDPEKDHLLGEMSDDLKKLFTLWRKAGQETQAVAKKGAETSMQIVLNLQLDSSVEPKKLDLEDMMEKVRVIEVQLANVKDREDALRLVFWLSVQDEFPAAGGNILAACKGFKIAWSEKEEERIPQVAGILIRI